jgi:sugar phosphate isomerase/epimerase
MNTTTTISDIAEFCDKHGACRDGRRWALENCESMAEAWDTLKPEWLIWVATRLGVLDDRRLRLFACFCARQNWHSLTDERSRTAVEVAERFAAGLATSEELAAAGEAAWAAAQAAAWEAAREAAWEAAQAAARDAAWDAAWDAAGAAARDAQAAWLRAGGNPFVKSAAGEGK